MNSRIPRLPSLPTDMPLPRNAPVQGNGLMQRKDALPPRAGPESSGRAAPGRTRRTMASRLVPFTIAIGLVVATPPAAAENLRLRDMPLVAAHSNLMFALNGGMRQQATCGSNENCPVSRSKEKLSPFASQVQRLTEALQLGADFLYPDLAQRVPGLVRNTFDVYVVDNEQPGSDSSADGRIRLNSGLGTVAPYDHWLAFVIAREMGHVIARHHESNSEASLATSLIMNILLPGSSLIKSLVAAGGSKLAAVSKHAEQRLAADVIAFNILNAAGYRLSDVVLALRITEPLPNERSWSRDLTISADDFGIRVQREKSAVVPSAPTTRQVSTLAQSATEARPKAL